MANFLKKVINKQSSIRLISSLSLTHQKTPFFNLTPHLFLKKDKNGTTLNPNFSYDDLDQKGGNGVGVGSHMVYSSFSLGLFLNPGLGNGVELGLGLGSVGGNVNVVGDEAERSGVVWADSVKKKRKKKMNKHKYKKLRKRLRKKTKKT